MQPRWFAGNQSTGWPAPSGFEAGRRHLGYRNTTVGHHRLCGRTDSGCAPEFFPVPSNLGAQGLSESWRRGWTRAHPYHQQNNRNQNRETGSASGKQFALGCQKLTSDGICRAPCFAPGSALPGRMAWSLPTAAFTDNRCCNGKGCSDGSANSLLRKTSWALIASTR